MANNKSALCFLLLSLFLSPMLLIKASASPSLSPSPSPSPSSSDAPRLQINYLFQFGDSLNDAGNLIRESSGGMLACGALPYGETIHNTTGRCSDGFLMVDYFAQYFGLPLLSPYLNREGDFRHGVNFAVAGSTALDTSALMAMGVISPVTRSSLSVQLNWFRSHLNSICHSTSDCREKVRNSLILMGETGGNDYNYALLERKTMDQLRSMVPSVVQTIKQAVEEVINLGAIRVVIPGNFPIGCMPIYLSTFESEDPSMYDELHCLKDLNEFVKYHNEHLQQAITELQQEYPDVAIVYGDYYSGLRWILENASSLGFNEDGLQKACCGASYNKYNFDMRLMCGTGVPVCANPAERFSWDGIHLTQHAYQQLAGFLLRGILPNLKF